MQQHLYGEVQAYFDAVLAKQGLPALPHFLFDSFIALPDRYLQLTADAFEYPRRDLPETVRFVGPLLPPPSRGSSRPTGGMSWTAQARWCWSLRARSRTPTWRSWSPRR